MLKQRVITAVLLVIVVLAALFVQNPIYWQGLINLVMVLGFYEWLRFCGIDKPVKLVVCYGLFALSLYVLQMGYIPMMVALPAACIVWLVLLTFTLTNTLLFLHTPWLKMLLGVFILSIAGALVISIKSIANGPLWIVCFLGAVCAADIGAYFVGRRFGKTKLAPSISPGKTVEGFLGGLALVTLVYVPALFYLFAPKAAILLFVTVLVTAVVSVGGDLFESKLKRHVGLKDSSQILPGHGGILDRIDSILVGGPFFSAGLMLLGYLS